MAHRDQARSVASGLVRNVHVEVRVKASPKGIQMQIRYMSLCMSNNVKPTGCQIPLLTYRVTILSPLPPGLAVTRYSPQGTVLYNTII